MALMAKNLGRRNDLPMLESLAVASLAAGTAADPAQDLVITSIPDLSKGFLPANLGEGLAGSLPRNRMSVRAIQFVAQAAAATLGNATNNCVLYVKLWRNNVLQGILASYPLNVAGITLGTAVTAAGIQTVTPSAMTGIVAGLALVVDTGGSQEVVYPYNVTSTQFTAYFTKTHASNAAVSTGLIPYTPIYFLPAIAANTTASTAVGAPGSATITPASMLGIHVGDTLYISGGVGTAEAVVVTAVTMTTFTAVFANTHSGTYSIQTGNAPLTSNGLPFNYTPANEPFEIREGDVLAFNRVSNNVTGLATPAGLLNVEWVSSQVLA